VAGETATLRWTIRNVGSDQAVGPWHDRLYLVRSPDADPVAVEAGEVLVGEGVVLGPGQSYTATGEIRVPGSIVANHRWQVTTNVRGEVFEGLNGDNNSGVSAATVALDVPELPIDGAALSRVFGEVGEFHWFKLAPQGDQDVLVSLDLLAADGSTELYLAQGYMPDRQHFDVRQTEWNSADVSALLASTSAQTYYATAYARSLSGATEFTIGAEALVFSLSSIDQTTVGNAGKVTLGIRGGRFEEDLDYEIVDPQGATHVACDVFFVNSSLIYATFEMAGLPAGRYDAQARRGAITETLPDALTVITGSPGLVEYNISAPEALRPGWTGEVTVEYRNIGKTDVPAPLMQLVVENANMSFMIPRTPGAPPRPHPASQPLFTSEFMLGINHNGPAGVLPPGAGGSIAFTVDPTIMQGTVVYRLDGVTDPSEPVPWDMLSEVFQPYFVPDDAWQAIFANLQAEVGGTVGEYNAVMADNATYLSRLGDYVNKASDLALFELAQSGLATITKRYTLGAFGRGLTHPWDIWGEVVDDRPVLYYPVGRAREFYLAADQAGDTNARYVGVPGDYATLTASISNDTWTVEEVNGVRSQFVLDPANPDRLVLDYIEERNGHRATVQYTDGRVNGVAFSNGDTVTLHYNAQGRIDQQTDPFGEVTTFSYDASGEHLTAITGPAGTTSLDYVAGQGAAREHAIRSVTYPSGKHMYYEYDHRGRLTRRYSDGGAGRIDYSYDSAAGVTITDLTGSALQLFGNRYGQFGKMITPTGHTVRFDYDTDHNLTRMFTPETTLDFQMAYDAVGNLTELVGPQGYGLDAEYNGYGRIETLVDSRGNASRFSLDPNGNLQSVTYPDGSDLQFTFDASGYLTQWTNRRGDVIHYTVDPQGLLTRVDYEDGAYLDYTYDESGNLLSVGDAAGTVGFAYDEWDWLTGVSYPNGRSLQYSYDAAGRRTQMVTQDGFTLNYSYDALGRMAGVSDGAGAPLVEYTYDAAGRLAREDKGNGTYSTYEYDDAGRTTRLANYGSDGAVLSRFEYVYDDFGMITSMTTLEGIWTYGYDAQGQLTGVVLPDGQQITYAYDSAGNRRSVTHDGLIKSYYTNNMDQYLAVGAATYTYDADGNLSSETEEYGTRTYTYDADNRLVAATTPEGTVTYEYDLLGNRTATVCNGQRTEYLVDPFGLGNVVAEYDGNGNLVARYVHSLGLVSRIDPTDTAAYYAFDAAANTVQLTGAAGAPLNAYEYLPFGETLSRQETVSNPFTFVGRYGVSEEADGRYNMRRRWYSPEVGRFTQPDPIGPTAGSANLYRYAANLPNMMIDPSGLYASMESLVMGEFGDEIIQMCLDDNADWDNFGSYHPWLRRTQQLFRSIIPTLSAEDFNDPVQGTALMAWLLTGEYPLHEFQNAEIDWHLLVPYTGITHEWCPGLGHGDGQNFRPVWELREPPPDDVAASQAYDEAGELFENYVLEHCRNPLRHAPLGPCKPHPNSTAGKADGGNPGQGTIGYLPYETTSAGGKSDCPECDEFCPLTTVDTEETIIIGSIDPNDILGPAGFGDENFLPEDVVLSYTIRFENDEEATAAAQGITITQQLDDDLDWSTFELGKFGFGEQVYSVPAGLQAYDNRLDLREKFGLDVDVAAALEPDTGVVTWRFTSIDPKTDAPTRDPFAGFLPPNVDPPEGDGYVNYSIRPKSSVLTGTQIDAEASIVFDYNPPIDTPPIFHTIDAGLPNSQLDPVSAVRQPDDRTFTLNWSGSDEPGGSGLESFCVMVSADGKPFYPWLSHTTETSAEFTGKPGHRYEFFSVAWDHVGHGESPPIVPDAETLILAEVVGRHIFYNNSTFDGNDPAPTADDDHAIAPSPAETDDPALGKTALLRGQTASFQNYTSYAGGINGIMVDVAEVSGEVEPYVGSFQFRVGNDDAPDRWPLAPPPENVSVRRGAGVGGSDRVTIIWPDGAIRNQWLQVTVLADAFRLPADDVFYFGNATGEIGNSSTEARVNAIDVLLAHNNPRTLTDPAPIDFPCDFNRDQRVNATDMLIARNNQTHSLNALKLITVPDGKAAVRSDVDAAFAEEADGMLHWLYELEETATERRASDEGVEDAVDLLLAGV